VNARGWLPRVLLQLILGVLAAVSLSAKDAVPALAVEHVAPGGAFMFKAPQGWTFAPSSARRDLLVASGDSVIIWFLPHRSIAGTDGLHISCMAERMAPPMAVSPEVVYEYDFGEGETADLRLLDSAFYVRYDRPIAGVFEWRQRNVTFIGKESSLCVIVNVPTVVWKKSKGARKLIDAVVKSIRLPVAK
jgi:hypothetical protein